MTIYFLLIMIAVLAPFAVIPIGFIAGARDGYAAAIGRAHDEIRGCCEPGGPEQVGQRGSSTGQGPAISTSSARRPISLSSRN